MTEKVREYTVKELALKMANYISSTGYLLEELEHVRNVFSRMAVDAKDKYSGELQAYFLWDNNDTLQTVDNLMFRLMKDINEEYKKTDDEMQSLLHELTKVEELDDKKSHPRGNEEKAGNSKNN